MTSGHSHVTRNEVYIDIPRNINQEEVIIDLNQIRFQPRSGQTKDLWYNDKRTSLVM